MQEKAYYQLFRNFFQIIDLLTYSHKSFNYPDSSVVLATLYLSLGVYMRAFNLDTVQKQFPFSAYCLSNFPEFNNLFEKFLLGSVSKDYSGLIEPIQYVSRFFYLPMDYSSPLIQESDKVIKTLK